MVKKIFLAICLVSFAAKVSAAHTEKDTVVDIASEYDFLRQRLAVEQLEKQTLAEKLAAEKLKTSALAERVDAISGNLDELNRQLGLAGTLAAKVDASLETERELALAKYELVQIKCEAWQLKSQLGRTLEELERLRHLRAIEQSAWAKLEELERLRLLRAIEQRRRLS